MTDWKKTFGTVAVSFLRSFLAAGLGIVISAGAGVLDMTATDWKGVAAAALAAGLVTIYKALDTTYTAYGIGAGDGA